MALKSITIRNFKALQNIHLTELPNFVVLVGANGSGKSTLFDVFGFLRDALTGNVRQALDARGGFPEVVTRGHEGASILVQLQVELPIAGRSRLVTYHLAVGLENGRPVVLHEFLRYKRGRHCAPFYFLDFRKGTGFAIRNLRNIHHRFPNCLPRRLLFRRAVLEPFYKNKTFSFFLDLH